MDDLDLGPRNDLTYSEIRELVRGFLSLPARRQLDIATELGLADATDCATEVPATALLVARSRSMLRDLLREVRAERASLPSVVC